MNSGWMWRIPVQGRMGCEYVFSETHLSPEDAKTEVEKHLRQPIEVRRIINIDPGRLENAWVGNYCAIGLAQSFLEPLEATSIHGSLVQLILLRESGVLSGDKPQSSKAVQSHNDTVDRQVNNLANFINLHYAGDRSESAFWRDVTGDGIAQAQRDKIAHWQNAPMTRADFIPLPGGMPHVEEQLHLPVMGGLGLLPKSASKTVFAQPNIRSTARQTANALQTELKSASARAVSHN